MVAGQHSHSSRYMVAQATVGDVRQGHSEALVQLGDIVLSHVDGDIRRGLTYGEGDVSKPVEELVLGAGIGLPVCSNAGEVTGGPVHLEEDKNLMTKHTPY